jgi:hypothetical protein
LAPQSRSTDVPYAQIDDGIQLYYEQTGAEDAPVILQFGGGGLFSHNFWRVHAGVRQELPLI